MSTPQALHKAVRADMLAPKRKHVRQLIVDSWKGNNINVYKLLEKEPVTKNGCAAFKALTVIHKMLQEGPPRFLKRSYNSLGFLRIIQNFWSTAGSSDVHYARLNVEYAYFLRGKLTFHHKHPLVLGKLSLDDYKNKIKNQPEVPLQTRQQMVSHLLDLQEMILRVQDTIFTFNGRDLHESKKAALVPLIVEGDAVMRITEHHIKALCERAKDPMDVQRYIQRYSEHYPRFRLFFDNSSRIPYVTDLMQVPVLPGDVPQFVVTGELFDLVPLPEQNIPISALMLEEGGEGQASQQQGAGSQQAGQQAAGQQAGQQDGAAAQQGTRDAGAAGQQSGAGEEGKTPEGWVSFDEGAEAEQAKEVSGGVAPQQAQLTNDELERLRNLISQRDAEIAYWQQACAGALRQAQNFNRVAEENRQRADELEQHLATLLQQQQREKEDRLMRKLDGSVNSVMAALERLKDQSVPSNLSSTPEQILSAHQQVLQALVEVESAAHSRDHQELISSTKRLVGAGVEQSEHSKGVCKLTDDDALSQALEAAARNATESIHKLLGTIKENPYDADPIVGDVVVAREYSIELERATQAIINAEKVSSGEEDLTEKASSELTRAAQVIEEAARALLEAKRLAEEKARNSKDKEQMKVAGSIVGGAMAITDAIRTLIEYATILQKENVAAGRARGDGNVYKKDVAWSEGLISAASSVAATVQDLVNKANGAVEGTVENEAVVVSSKAMAAATAQLLVASRVRSDPNSQAQKNLEAASKAVTQATRTLTLAAQTEIKQETVEEETRASLDGLSLTEVKIREMEQQAQILKLEKELEMSRIRLASMRKAQYRE